MSGHPVGGQHLNRRKSDRWFPSLWRPELLHSNIDTRIAGTRMETIFHEFINNSAHFPIAVLALEYISPLYESTSFLVHAMIMLSGVLAQSVFLGTAEFVKEPKPLIGNLIAPLVCISIFIIYLGRTSDFHLSTWGIFLGYSFLVGISQEIRFRNSMIQVKHLSILFESILRACILLVMLWKAHQMIEGEFFDVEDLFSETYHLYIFIMIPLFGMLVGMVNINAFRYMTILRQTAVELKKYSEWLLGPDLLKKSLNNPMALNLHTADRTVFFMDIRGFTHWSDKATPQEVVNLINEYFQTAEDVLKGSNAIKVELTGDEILAAFYQPEMAVLMALRITDAVNSVLHPKNLSVGVGINTGPMIEGLVGGRNLKKFSVMGDAVNTGKRISDVAIPDEILLSEATREALGNTIIVGEARAVSLKGKEELMRVFPLLGLRDVDINVDEALSKLEPLIKRIEPATLL